MGEYKFRDSSHGLAIAALYKHNGYARDGITPNCSAKQRIFFNMEHIMSKSQDSKKAVKKEPAKTPKEKKEAKKIKKEASKRQ